MKIFVYLDESGSIHKNSSTKYFAVGGYFTLERDRQKIISSYREITHEYKSKRNIKFSKEIKGRDMNSALKEKILTDLQSIESFYGIAKVFDKTKMRKEILNSNIFYNYAVRLIFDDCIFPLISFSKVNEPIEFILNLDNRSLALKDLFSLEKYLNIEYSKDNFSFRVTYLDSKINYSIQLADLIVNTFYNYFNNKHNVASVYDILILKKFRVSIFPGGKTFGRRYKIKIWKVYYY